MAKKKSPSSKSPASSGGTLMSMRSGFQKVTGTKRAKSKASKWTFQQVLFAVAGVALILALVYAMSR